MPWSDWITPDPELVSPTRLAVGWSDITTLGGVEFIPVGSQATSYTADYNGAVALQRSNGWQHTAQSNWSTFREWFPDLLDDLTEGVDYGVIPGRDPFGDDAYVDYEAGDNLHLSWQFNDILVNNAAADTPGETFTWAIGITGGTTYADGDSPSWPGIGASFGTGDESSTGVNVGPPPDPSPALSFTILALASDYSGTDLAQVSLDIDGHVEPAQLVQMPRWRYWIPGPDIAPPLRLRQRDDDLFISAGHLRNRSSRQTTPRLRGYL